jgi:hypothetical protein
MVRNLTIIIQDSNCTDSQFYGRRMSTVMSNETFCQEMMETCKKESFTKRALVSFFEPCLRINNSGLSRSLASLAFDHTAIYYVNFSLK